MKNNPNSRQSIDSARERSCERHKRHQVIQYSTVRCHTNKTTVCRLERFGAYRTDDKLDIECAPQEHYQLTFNVLPVRFDQLSHSRHRWSSTHTNTHTKHTHAHTPNTHASARYTYEVHTDWGLNFYFFVEKTQTHLVGAVAMTHVAGERQSDFSVQHDVTDLSPRIIALMCTRLSYHDRSTHSDRAWELVKKITLILPAFGCQNHKSNEDSSSRDAKNEKEEGGGWGFPGMTRPGKLDSAASGDASQIARLLLLL